MEVQHTAIGFCGYARVGLDDEDLQGILLYCNEGISTSVIRDIYVYMIMI